MKVNRLIFRAGLVLLSIGAGVGAAEPTLKKVIPTNDVQFVRSFSEDGKAATLMFDNFAVSTAIGKGSLPSVVTKQFTLVIQPDSQTEVCVTQDLRGFINTVGSGSAALMVQAGGKTTLVDFKKATGEAEGKTAKSERKTYQSAKKSAEAMGFSVPKPPEGSHDYFQRIETRVPAGQPLQITILLLVERLPGENEPGALLTVDTLDFEVHPVAAK